VLGRAGASRVLGAKGLSLKQDALKQSAIGPVRSRSEPRPAGWRLDRGATRANHSRLQLEPTGFTPRFYSDASEALLRKATCMIKNALMLAAAVLLFPNGTASAQTQTPPQYDSSGAPVPPGSTVTPRPSTGDTPNDSSAGTSGRAPRDERLPADRDPNIAPVPVSPPASAPITQSR
jgi:hypothetical protein